MPKINEPTHILEHSFSCINLVFTTQLYLVVESEIHLSLHPNFQIVTIKFFLQNLIKKCITHHHNQEKMAL